ncbi:MAG: YdcF family protein [Sporomusaceae bacterium]|nr:YdcF family protein [Sporomusaceae bacterium]
MRKRSCLLILLLLAIATIEIPIIAVGQTAMPQPADTIIVLGARLSGREPGAMLRLRLEEAARLYAAGYAPVIIVSGGLGSDEEISEAAAMKKFLVDRGIPAAAIYPEDQSRNTFQNLAFSQRIMREHQLATAIIVSNASHIRRALVLAAQLGLPATGAAAPMADSLYLTAKQYAREGAAVAALLFIQPH